MALREERVFYVSNLRPGFLKIIDGWSKRDKLTDIPNRLKRIEEWQKTVGDLTDAEQELVSFMKDTQQTREFVRRKPDNDD